MESKKADLSITVIITAVIGLIVLGVIIAIFTTATQKTTQNIGSCAAKGGLCANDNFPPRGEIKPDDKCGGDYPVPLLVSGDCERTPPKDLCCLKIKD